MAVILAKVESKRLSGLVAAVKANKKLDKPNFDGIRFVNAEEIQALIEKLDLESWGHCDFTNADFTDGDFTRASRNLFRSGIFVGANLANADFSGVTMDRSDFTRANIAGTNFTHASLDNAHFIDFRQENPEGYRWIPDASFIGASLFGVRFVLSGDEKWRDFKANFSDAVIRRGHFEHLGLRNASFMRFTFDMFTSFCSCILDDTEFDVISCILLHEAYRDFEKDTQDADRQAKFVLRSMAAGYLKVYPYGCYKTVHDMTTAFRAQHPEVARWCVSVLARTSREVGYRLKQTFEDEWDHQEEVAVACPELPPMFAYEEEGESYEDGIDPEDGDDEEDQDQAEEPREAFPS